MPPLVPKLTHCAVDRVKIIRSCTSRAIPAVNIPPDSRKCLLTWDACRCGRVVAAAHPRYG